MIIGIYSRKSKYTGKGESIGNQVEMCKEYIHSHIKGSDSAEIIIYEDEGYSAKNIDRPQFQKMLMDSKANKLDYIVCYRLDRISRNVSDFASLIEYLSSKDIAFICIKEQFDTSSPMGRAMMYIASVFAQLERETIAERVRDNMMMLARTGRWLGGTTPTGFDSEKVESLIIDGKLKSSFKLKFNSKEIAIVKEIYNQFLKTGSISSVSKYLISKNIKSRSGKYFSNLGIKEILTNPVYCIADENAYNYFVEKKSDVCFSIKGCTNKYGLTSFNKRNYNKKHAPRNDESKWIIAIGKHHGIVCGQDWVNIQKRLEQNKPTSDKKATNTHNTYSLLSGMIFCQKCGERMFAKPRNNSRMKSTFDYICNSKLKGNTSLCNCQNLNGMHTDDLVCDYLMDYMNIDSNIYKMIENLKSKIKNENKADRLSEIDNQISKHNEEINNLVSSLSQPNISKLLIEKIDSNVLRLTNQIDELQKEKEQILKASSDLSSDTLQLDIIARTLSYFKEHFKQLSVNDKREIIKLLVEKITWDGENLDIFIYGE